MSFQPNMPSIDGYVFEEEIGGGGFSTVYKAKQPSLERTVAIKVLKDNLADQSQRDLYISECKTMGQLSAHDGIVTIYGTETTRDGFPALVMEMYDGTLRDRGTCNAAMVVEVGIQAANALARIHDAGVIHRDVKPHNIFVKSGGGKVAIGDFGISSVQTERTVPGSAGFSIDYAPPEVFDEGRTDFAGDIYSLGATLYHAATGQVPFPSAVTGMARLTDVGRKIIRDPVPSLGAQLPRGLDYVLSQAMAKRSSDRQHSASEVAEQLRRVQAEIGAPVSTLRSLSDIQEGGHQRGNKANQATEGTVVRGGNIAVAEPPPPAQSEPLPVEQRTQAPKASRRGLLLALAGGLTTVCIVVGLFMALLTRGENESRSATQEPAGAANSNAVTSTSVPNFELLSPPAALSVAAISETQYEISWTEEADGLRYHIQLLNSDDNEIVDTSPFIWELDDASTSACFEVRTVGADELSMSQMAAGPACG